jgi:hypothetical protein
MSGRGRRRAALLALVLALGGCSLLSFVYGRLDSIATAYADRWFDLDSAQARRFKLRAGERLALNRREELPGYSRFLRDAAALVERRPSPDEVDALVGRARSLLEDGIERSLPLITATLAELSPAQVAHFAREIDEANAEYREEELEVSVERRQRERRDDLRREVERWTGRLQPTQRALLERLVERVPDGARAWYEHRLERQRGMLALLRAGASADQHGRYVREWWLGDRHLAPEHAAQLARDRRATVEAVAELIGSLTPRQRERASARLLAIAADLDELHAAGREAAERG